ncbi:Gag-Pro-Pol polyprotein [Cucumispora dikerogammari]|nr:Gag-Pro-Pol polyprotein [Cucumispora dikerogammari]
MSKVSKIITEEKRRSLIVYLLTGTIPNGLNSKALFCFKRKAVGFTYDYDILNYSIKEKKYIYACDFEYNLIEDVCDNFFLPGHLRRNILKSEIYKKYVRISAERIPTYVDSCLLCRRELVLTPTLPPTSIIPIYIRERLIVDTIDLSEYSDMNGGIKYFFTTIDSFSKFAWCTPSLTKSGAAFLNALKDLHKRKGTWKIFHSNNGDEFTFNAVQEYIANRMQTKFVYGALYRPQS